MKNDNLITKDAIVALISTPESNDDAIISQLYNKDREEIITDFYNWMNSMTEISNSVLTEDLEILSSSAAKFTLVAPQKLQIGIVSTTDDDRELNPLELIEHFSGHSMDFIIYMPVHKDTTVKNISFEKLDNILVMDMNWMASIIIEKNLPFFAQLGGRKFYKKGA